MSDLKRSDTIGISAGKLRYDGESAPVCAIPAGWELPMDGRVVVVRGQNGAGKTTLLHWLAQTRVAVSISEDLEFPRRFRPDKILRIFGCGLTREAVPKELQPEARAWELLSRGNRQKVRILLGGGLAAAEKTEAEVCLFDEPTAGLDESAQRAFWRYVVHLGSRLAGKTTVLVATHEWQEARVWEKDIVVWRVEKGGEVWRDKL